ncbi:MAG: DUF521 domain-containing protein [Xanthomonadales bacterium]|nr:DUF521 domain-containing protein [Xanthomonadales bacterium]
MQGVLNYNEEQRDFLQGVHGEAAAMAMRILSDMARVEGVRDFVAVTSAHVDGCVYHGDTGCYFAEKLASAGARVRIPTSLNVGAMDLRQPSNVLLEGATRDLAIRQMNAYVAMGCTPSWTCAPYQAGFRPSPGEQVAWAESNAVVFANSVLGARSNRYGDFLDICCAITGYAPNSGLHRPENRLATLVIDASGLSRSLKKRDDFYPVLGWWLGHTVGAKVAAIVGLPLDVSEDRLKALGAAAASTGAVGLFHVVGVTPEAPTLERALGGAEAVKRIVLNREILLDTHRRMSPAGDEQLDVVALGSPHFSISEFKVLLGLLKGRKAAIPIYVCTGRHVIDELGPLGLLNGLDASNITVVADTCVVVTPVLSSDGGVLMTNSGKFAHYGKSLTGHDVVFGSLEECVNSAIAGRVIRDKAAWGVA